MLKTVDFWKSNLISLVCWKRLILKKILSNDRYLLKTPNFFEKKSYQKVTLCWKQLMFSKKSLSNQQPYLPCMLKTADSMKKKYPTCSLFTWYVENGWFFCLSTTNLICLARLITVNFCLVENDWFF